MKNIWIPGLLVLLFSACQQNAGQEAPAEPKESLYQRLAGTWETTYIKVDVRSADNQPDSSYLFEVEEGEWERLYRIKPHRTYFSTDSTFRTVHRGLPGDVMSEDRGLWNTFGDTLMMIQPTQTTQFKVAFRDGKAHFVGLTDFDNDGQADDSYYAIHRFIGKHAYE